MNAVCPMYDCYDCVYGQWNLGAKNEEKQTVQVNVVGRYMERMDTRVILLYECDFMYLCNVHYGLCTMYIFFGNKSDILLLLLFDLLPFEYAHAASSRKFVKKLNIWLRLYICM